MMAITLREFADKYGLPYVTVYNASTRCTWYNESNGKRLYDEHELFEKTLEMVRQNLKKCQDQADRQIGYLERLQGIW